MNPILQAAFTFDITKRPQAKQLLGMLKPALSKMIGSERSIYLEEASCPWWKTTKSGSDFGYNHGTQGFVSEINRLRFADWLFQFIVERGLQFETFFATMKYLDSYSRARRPAGRQWYLAALGATLLASRFYDVESISPEDCLHACKKKYTLEELLLAVSDIHDMFGNQAWRPTIFAQIMDRCSPSTLFPYGFVHLLRGVLSHPVSIHRICEGTPTRLFVSTGTPFINKHVATAQL